MSVWPSLVFSFSSTYNRASDVACTYVSHVLDRKLLERLMSPSPKSQVMFAPAFSWIGDFFRIFGIHIFQVMASLVNFCLRFTAPLSGRSLSNKAAHHITAAKIGDAGVHGKRLKIGDAGVPRHVKWAAARDPRSQIGDTMNKGGPLTMQNVTWRR